jgi:uncharacterized protein (AIM24 family)
MQCHEIDYKIIGDDTQIVEVELDSGETIVAEAGAINYRDDGITFEARMGDRILQHAPSAGGSRKGEGSLPETIGDLIDGDNR